MAGRLFGKAIYTESLCPGPGKHGGVWSVANQCHLLTESSGQNMGGAQVLSHQVQRRGLMQRATMPGIITIYKQSLSQPSGDNSEHFALFCWVVLLPHLMWEPQ